MTRCVSFTLTLFLGLSCAFVLPARAGDSLCDEPLPITAEDQAPRLFLLVFERALPQDLQPCIEAIRAQAYAGNDQALDLLAGPDQPVRRAALAQLAPLPVTADTVGEHLEVLTASGDALLWEAWIQSLEIQPDFSAALIEAVVLDPSLLALWPTGALDALRMDNRLADDADEPEAWRLRISERLLEDPALLEAFDAMFTFRPLNVDIRVLAPVVVDWSLVRQEILIQRVPAFDLDTLAVQLQPSLDTLGPLFAMLGRYHHIPDKSLTEPWRKLLDDSWRDLLGDLFPVSLRGALHRESPIQEDPDMELFDLFVNILQNVLEIDEMEFLAAVATHADPDLRRLTTLARLEERVDAQTLRTAIAEGFSIEFLAEHFTRRMYHEALQDLYVDGDRYLGQELIAAANCRQVDDLINIVNELPADHGWQTSVRQRAQDCRIRSEP